MWTYCHPLFLDIRQVLRFAVCPITHLWVQPTISQAQGKSYWSHRFAGRKEVEVSQIDAGRKSFDATRCHVLSCVLIASVWGAVDSEYS